MSTPRAGSDRAWAGRSFLCVIFHRDFGKTWHVVFIVVSSWSVAVVLFPERYFECAHSGNSALCPTRSFLGRHLAQITAALKHFLQFRTSHSMRKTLSAPVLPLMEHLGALLNEMPPSDTDQGSWPSQSVEMDKRPVQKFRQGLTGAPAAAGGERKQVTGSLARSPHPRGGKLVPYTG